MTVLHGTRSASVSTRPVSITVSSICPTRTATTSTACAWNGLTTVTESPSGAESNTQYRGQHHVPEPHLGRGVRRHDRGFHLPGRVRAVRWLGRTRHRASTVGQQGRRPFGLVYRTLVGQRPRGHGSRLQAASDLRRAGGSVGEGVRHGQRLARGDQRSRGRSRPRRSRSTGSQADVRPDDRFRPSRIRPISTDLEDILFGTDGDDARLPSPDEVIALFEGSVVDVDLTVAANQPTFVAGTGVITLPDVTGVQWKVGGANKAPGAQPALSSGQSADGPGHGPARIQPGRRRDLEVQASVIVTGCTRS